MGEAGGNEISDDSRRGETRRGKVPITFLLNYSDPCNSRIADLHEALERSAGSRDLQSEGGPSSSSSIEWPCIIPPLEINNILPFDSETMVPSFMHSPETYTRPYKAEEAHLTEQTSRPQGRLLELVAELIRFQTSTADVLCRSSRLSPAQAQELFTKENLERYTEAYFTRTYRHFPILHEKSFDSSTCCLSLLLAVFLAGSVHSSPQDSAFLAQDCFDLAEGYVFKGLGSLSISSRRESSRMPSVSTDELQVLQAAALVFSLQIAAPHIHVRSRVRHQRYPVLLSVARSFSLFGVRNNLFWSSSSTSPLSDWQNFVFQESTVRYDTVPSALANADLF
jgi:hypothetical protein